MKRKTISLLTLLSFILLALSSVALYILPGGRSALPGQMMWLGFSKGVWRDVHITGGFLFLAVAAWHTALNARLLLAYVRGRVLSLRSLLPLGLALAITATVYAGTIAGWEPMRTVLALGRQGKSMAAMQGGEHAPTENAVTRQGQNRTWSD